MRFNPKHIVRFGCLSAALMMMPAVGGHTAALAQIDPDVQIRLNYLENEIQTLNRAVYKGEMPAGQSQTQTMQSNADLQAQIQDFEVQMRQLNGQIEEVAHSVNLLRKDMEKVGEDTNLRFSDLEQKVSALSAAMEQSRAYTASSHSDTVSVGGEAAAKADAAPSVQSILGKAKAEAEETTDTAMLEERPFLASESGGAAALAQYEQAFSLLKQGKYNSAQLGFESFLKKNPEHALASNAKYWLGETYYVRGDYSAAARIFAEGFQAYPRGAKAPDNLLKLGLSLESLGKKEDACVALNQVKKEFPAGASAVLSRTEKEIERLKCQ